MIVENDDLIAKVSIGGAFTATLVGFGFWIYKRCFAGFFLKGSGDLSESTPIMSNGVAEVDLESGNGFQTPRGGGNHNIYNSFALINSIVPSPSSASEVSREELLQLTAKLSCLDKQMKACQKTTEKITEFLMLVSLRNSEVLVQVHKNEEGNFLSEEVKHEKFKLLAQNDFELLSEFVDDSESSHLQSDLESLVTKYIAEHQMNTLGSDGYDIVQVEE